MENKSELDENTELVLLLKYIITLKNIKKSDLKIKDLGIELDNLQTELNHIKEILTTTKLNNSQQISLDNNNNLKISWNND